VGGEQAIGRCHAGGHVAGAGDAAHHRARHGHEQRGWRALSGNVGDNDCEPVRIDQKIIVEIAADLARRVHLGMEIDPLGRAVAHPWFRQDRLLDLRGCLHFLAAMLLGADLCRHPGKHPGEGRQFARLVAQLVEQCRIIFVAPQRLCRIGQGGERVVHRRQTAAKLPDDRHADRRIVGAEAHQAVVLDADHDEIGARDDARRARQIGKDAKLADDPIRPDRRQMDRSAGERDENFGLPFEDHTGKAAGIAFAHDGRAGRVGGEPAMRRHGQQRLAIDPRENRVRRQYLGDFLDRPPRSAGSCVGRR